MRLDHQTTLLDHPPRLCVRFADGDIEVFIDGQDRPQVHFSHYMVRGVRHAGRTEQHRLGRLLRVERYPDGATFGRTATDAARHKLEALCDMVISEASGRGHLEPLLALTQKRCREYELHSLEGDIERLTSELAAATARASELRRLLGLG